MYKKENKVSLVNLSSPYDSETKFPIIASLDTAAKASESVVKLDDLADLSSLQRLISSVKLAANVPNIIFGLFSVLLYRYCYSDEYEIHFVSNSAIHRGGGNLSDISTRRVICKNPGGLNLLNFVGEIDEFLNVRANNELQVSSSEYAVVSIKGASEETLSSLAQFFNGRSGKLWILVDEDGASLKVSMLYNENHKSDITQLNQHLCNLINNVAEDPAMPLDQLSILDESEIRRQIEFGKGLKDDVTPRPVYQLIEEACQKYPYNIAAQFEGTRVTFALLNESANLLAHGLLESEVRIGDKVAVYLEPCVEVLVSIFALHKIGAVYVPIDPNFPPARIQAILEEVDPKLILVLENVENIPSSYKALCDSIGGVSSRTSNVSNPSVAVEVENLSHIYFTSGTTGKPKGALSTHKNLYHYISVSRDRFGFVSSDVLLAVARFTFSISMFELMTPLVVGGCVKLLSREAVLDLDVLAAEVSASTVIQFGPSLLKKLLPHIRSNYSSFETFDVVRHASTGGDMVPVEILEEMKLIFRNAEVFVFYGSSEISVMGCAYEVPKDRVVTKTLVGKPHKNVQVRLLDENDNMLPIGVAGQIYFAGAGIVDGYLNLPDLTNEKFRLIDGDRFYAIGDVGRFDFNGNLEVLGREDFQVQIRGMRVELTDIEACLKSNSNIVDCVVVAVEDEGGEKNLVAYLNCRADLAIASDELYRYMRECLPDFMIPSVYIKLDRFPLNHNGKLDRKALLQAGGERLALTSYVQPNTGIEMCLAEIWKDVLGVSRVGLHDDFFELGGNSLLAIKLVERIKLSAGIGIELSYFFQYSTISKFLQNLDKREIHGHSAVVPLQVEGDGVPIFCIYGIDLYRGFASELGKEQPVYGVFANKEKEVIDEVISGNKDSGTIKPLIDLYYQAIVRHTPRGPYRLAGLSFGGVLAFHVAEKLVSDGREVEVVFLFDSFLPSAVIVNRGKWLESRFRRLIDWRSYKSQILKFMSSPSWSGLGRKVDLDSKGVHMLDAVRRLDTGIDGQLKCNFKVVVFKAKRLESEFQFHDIEGLYGWGKVCAGELKVYSIGCEHLTMLLEPAVIDVCATVKRHLGVDDFSA